MDNGADDAKFREDLMNIARTTLSSKILAQHKEFFAKIAVDAVLRLKGSGNLQAIQIIKKQVTRSPPLFSRFVSAWNEILESKRKSLLIDSLI